MMRLIDSHAHLLELAKKSPQILDALLDAPELHDALIVDVGIHLDDLRERRDMHRKAGVAWWSLGLYPSIVRQENMVEELSRLQGLLEDLGPRQSSGGPCAIGECGIDHYRDYGPQQIPLFEAQLDLAQHHDLPVIIHCRDAYDDVLACLRSRQGRIRGVMHCFGADSATARACLDLGMYISLAGNATYGNNTLAAVARMVPAERLLVESDCPYLAPVPFRGKTNTPLFTSYTLGWMARERGQDVEVLAGTVADNFKNLFGPKPVVS